MLAIVYTLAMGLSIGATATVARRIGEHDPDGAARAAVQAITLAVLVATGLGIAGAVLAPSLLAIMGASSSVIETGSGFTRVMLGGNATILLLFLINAIFRGAGDAAIAMRTLWLANAINIVLAPCLIFGVGPFPEMGVTGAAVGTTIGRGTGVLFAATQLARRNGRIRIRREHLHLEPVTMLRLIRLSGTGMLQGFIATASWIGLIRILATFGSAALAGYTIAIRVVLFALLPSWGMSNAAATMVGQALGARKPERAERAVWTAGFYNVCFLGLIGVLFLVGAPGIVSLFSTDPAVAAYATTGLRVISLGFVFYAYGMVLSQSFNGAGDPWTPTLLNFLAFWMLEIPLAYVLAYWGGFGPDGVFWSVTIAFSVFAVMAAVMFRRGRWKTKVV
jgi:putative MATE family efflux protein